MRLSEFVLRYRLGESEWQMYPLNAPETRIGRGADNDLVLDHAEVSRYHLEIHFDGEVFRVIDLGSSNGTHVDGITLIAQTPTELWPGQMVTLGDFTLLLVKASEVDALISKELIPFLLRYRFGTDTWQTFPIEPGEKVLGRDPNCDFYLNDSEVSRRHASLKIAEEQIWLTDLASTNGTTVGGVALKPNKPYPLQLGQTFAIGNFVLRIDEPTRSFKASPKQAKRVGVGMASVDLGLVQALNLSSRPRTTLGRGGDNDVIIPHPLVNRHHAAIEHYQEGYRLLDLGSTHGVFLNGKRIKRAATLKDWDQIQIGAATYLFSGHDLQQQASPGLKIETVNLRQTVSRTRAVLDDLDLLFAPNDFVALVGATGSGKVALLLALSGFQPASHGKVLVNGLDLYQHYDLLHKEIGYVPQTPTLHAELTPESALEYAARLRLPSDTSPKERAARVAEILADLDLVSQRHIPIARLSSAQARRVVIGSELLTRPRLIFLEDPTQGLDPTACTEMIALLRHLADQGRTVISTLPATQNLERCDRLIFLTLGGRVAYFGSPEGCLEYFNVYRAPSERRKSLTTFEDVYSLLASDEHGSPAEWQARYLQSHTYQQIFGIDSSLTDLESAPALSSTPVAHPLQEVKQRVSGFRQFFTLSARHIRVLTHDWPTLTLLLGIAPILGLLDVLWGRNLYHPAQGDAVKIIFLWFFGALSAILTGAVSSLGEIVREVRIYRHERKIYLKIMPYIFSKLWPGIPLALGQAAILLVFRQFLVNPQFPNLNAYLAAYFTLFLTVFSGYLLGLVISAFSKTYQAAFSVLLIVLGIQVLFAGALLPLDWIAGAKPISFMLPARWSYEALVQTTGLGAQLAADPCWNDYPPPERLALPEIAKADCPCLGASIFTACADFPGILAPGFYTATTAQTLAEAEPVAPSQSILIQSSAPLPSPTWLPTPTFLPSPTPIPTPQNPTEIPGYLEHTSQQAQAYQKLIAKQFESYASALADQQAAYAREQGKSQLAAAQTQVDDYAKAWQTYQAESALWQQNRQAAIRNAEAVIASVYDRFPQVFEGALAERWLVLMLIQALLFVLLIWVQWHKDKT